MDQCEDREEGVPPSKSTLCGEHESQTKAQRIHQRLNPESELSCVSLKSHWSADRPINFKVQQASAAERIHERLHSPEPDLSGMSFKRHRSMDPPLNFKKWGISKTKVEQESSDVACGQSAQQNQKHNSIFMLLEDNIITFVKNELKMIQKVLSPDYPECLNSQREDDEMLEGKDEEQKRGISNREAFVNITLNFLKRMKQEELADRLQSKLPAAVCHRNLKSNLKKKFQCVFEGIAKAGNPTLLNQIYTEL
ncbi:uncharacterized protein LOC120730891 isoform X3 [Simochromis diagramma]|uniref:uncharacterized protein LOC120730891 isoform X3 n=1 Tax=Simochromis diagramma TaxID=43689 RepID=UPI001A7EB59C|nr:uncharacterized protein LOC120730891 isoform X3 [Simochromis diagramma]